MVMGQSFLPRMWHGFGIDPGAGFWYGGVGVTVLGWFADLWGVPATLWIIAFIPWVAFLPAALIPYPMKKALPEWGCPCAEGSDARKRIDFLMKEE